MTGTSDIVAALAEAVEWIGNVPGVVAVGQGAAGDSPTVDVWIENAPPPGTLPEFLHGYPVRVIETGGPIRAQEERAQ